MVNRKFRDFLSEIYGERIFNYDQRICVLTRRSFERAVDIGRLPYFQRLKLTSRVWAALTVALNTSVE